MILGVGTDILQISRIEQALERTPKLAERILTSREQACFSAEKQPARFLAKRFAAKEAVTKALGTGIGRGVSWHHIEIDKDELGRPLVTLNGGAAERASELGIANIQISYSDEKEYIVAFVIAEG
ncbi:holo-ACP synthase [Neptuniibacter sp.]|uniref:holo-ACP synthase n=1 Tax=Neptuniibacter sp. TaxID=1962643 RepID=UPI003B5B4847